MALINLKRLEYSLSGLLDILAKPGIVPGVRSRAIMLPDNTVQGMDFDYVGKLSWIAASYGAATGNRIPILYFPAGMKEQKPARLLAGCKTCRHKLGVPSIMADGMVCGAWCFIQRK